MDIEIRNKLIIVGSYSKFWPTPGSLILLPNCKQQPTNPSNALAGAQTAHPSCKLHNSEYNNLCQFQIEYQTKLSMRSNPKQKQKFTIIVRIRPRLKEDSHSYKEPDMEEILEADPTSINIQRKNNQEKIFRFNHVMNPGEQKDVYQRCSHLVEAVFQGHNATFLAYGQTGTGKTHTVFGGEKLQMGYFNLAVEDVFNAIKKRLNERQFAVRVSFVEFYLDCIFDLLQGTGRKLEIKQSNEQGIHIRDLVEVSVRTAEELFSTVRKAVKTRKTEQTGANKRSSRSHAVIQITVLQRWTDNGETKYLKGMLKIVDLAGSERVSKTQSNGNRLQQAKRINKEITTLGKCINLLAQAQKQNKSLASDSSNKFNFNKSHIPYRDSKITRYLSESLEGKAKIILCVCISKFGIHLEQSFSSLIFATQASTLKVDSIRNDVYTMANSVKKPAEKSSSSFQTPLRSKTAQSKNERLSYRESSNNKSIFQNLNSSKNEHSRNPNSQKLVEKFKRELQQINEYLQKREINTKSQSKQTLESNLKHMHKIFNLMRENNLPSFY